VVGTREEGYLVLLWCAGGEVWYFEIQFVGWYKEEIKKLVDCCVIPHNMTMELRRNGYVFMEEM